MGDGMRCGMNTEGGKGKAVVRRRWRDGGGGGHMKGGKTRGEKGDVLCLFR